MANPNGNPDYSTPRNIYIFVIIQLLPSWEYYTVSDN